MIDDGDQDRDRSDLAHELYANHVSQLAAGEQADLDRLCAEHPEFQEDLRRLHAQWMRVEDLLADLRAGDDGGSGTESCGAESEGNPHALLILRLALLRRPHERYRVLEELGHGGMAVVHRVWDEDLRRRLAMKVIRSDEALEPRPTDPLTLGRFLDEAQVTAQLDHPGIIPIHELGLTADGRAYFTMKLVQGVTLCEILRSLERGEDGWNRTRVLGVILKVCEAMSYAHDKGVIHRDLKPANVMVGRYGEVYVVDWGLAKILDRGEGRDIRIVDTAQPEPSTVSSSRSDRRGDVQDSPLYTMDGDVVGTPAYMPPEQAAGRIGHIGPHSDVYSVGAILYHLLTGQMPYVAPGSEMSNRRVWLRVQASPPTPIRELAPECSPELIAICEQAMARDWTERYRTMSELASDIRAFLEGRVVAALETGTWAEARKWVRRNKLLATAMLIAISSLVVGLVTSSTQYANARRSLAEAEEANSMVEAHSYRAQIQAARSACDRGDWEDARKALDGCLPARRRWEWQHLQTRVDSSELQLGGHQAPITWVGYVQGGLRIVTVADDASMHAWDPSGGRSVVEVGAAASSVLCVAADPRERTIALGTSDGAIRILDVATGELVSVLRNEASRPEEKSEWKAIAFEPSSYALISVSADGEVLRWDPRGGAPTKLRERRAAPASRDELGLRPEIELATLAPDAGTLAAKWSDARLAIQFLHEDSERDRIAPCPPPLSCLSFSPDGMELAIASSDGDLRIEDVQSGISDARFADGLEWISEIVWTADGRWLAAGAASRSGTSSGTVRLWDLVGGHEPRVLGRHEDRVESLAFTERGDRLVSCGWDGTVRIWDACSGKPLAVLRGHESRVTCFALSPDELQIASGSRGGSLRLYHSLAGGDSFELAYSQILQRAASFSPDGELLAVAEHPARIRILDGRTLEPIRVLSGTISKPTCLAFSPEGARVVAGFGDSAPKCWPVDASSAPLELEWRAEGAVAVACALSNSLIAMAMDDGSIRLWDSETGRESTVLHGGGGPFTSVEFHPRREELAAGSSDGSVWMWNLARVDVPTKLSGPGPAITEIAYSPSEERVASAHRDGTLRIWDLEERTSVILEGHTSSVESVAYSSDGTRILSASADGTIRIWDPELGKELDRLKGPDSTLAAVQISADGRRLLSIGLGGALRLWPVGTSDLCAAWEAHDAPRRARLLIDELFSRRLLPGQVRLTLEDDGRVGASVRQIASSEIERRSPPSSQLDPLVWEIVRTPNPPAEELQAAIDQAGRAFREAPEETRFRRSYGLACFRAGRYEQAIEALSALDAPKVEPPLRATAQLLIALSHCKLGDAERARALFHSQAEWISELGGPLISAEDRAAVLAIFPDAEPSAR